MRFGCDADAVEWDGRFVGGPILYRLVADGKQVAVGSIAGTTGSAFIKFAFAEGACYRVLDLQILDPGWHGIKVPTGYAATKAVPFARRLVVEGDSLGAGASGINRHRVGQPDPGEHGEQLPRPVDHLRCEPWCERYSRHRRVT